MWRVEAALLLECLGLYLQFNVIIHCKIGMSFAHPYMVLAEKPSDAMPEP